MNFVQRSLFTGLPKLQESYTVVRAIGAGSFGEIFEVKRKGKKNSLAIKVERRDSGNRPTLRKEAYLMKLLMDIPGFPKIYKFTENGGHSLLIQKLLGENLERLFDLCGSRFSLKTTLMVADQLLSRLEVLHGKGVVHRDLKPENMTIGCTKSSFRIIHIIDFGLSKHFKEKNGQHIPFVSRKGMIGTVRYCSVNSHMGLELSRRDDLISLGYILIYFFKKELPWQDLPFFDKRTKYEKVHEMKTQLPLEELCKGLPEEFLIFMKYSTSLNFYEAPNYTYLKELFGKLFKNKGFTYDLEYDWMSTCEIIRKYPKSIRENLSSSVKEDNESSFSIPSHDYKKKKMAEGPRIIVKYPPITHLENYQRKPRLGGFLQRNKGGSMRNPKTENEWKIKKHILNKSNLKLNSFLDKRSSSNESRFKANSAGRAIVEVMGLNITKMNNYSGGLGSISKEDYQSIEKSREVSNSESQMLLVGKSFKNSEDLVNPNHLRLNMRFDSMNPFLASGSSNFMNQSSNLVANQQSSNNNNSQGPKFGASGNSGSNISQIQIRSSSGHLSSGLFNPNAPSISNFAPLPVVNDIEKEEDCSENDLDEYDERNSVQAKMIQLNSRQKIFKTKEKIKEGSPQNK